MIDLQTTTRQNLRLDEVVELLGVTRRTVYYWIENQTIECVIIDGSTRIPVEEVRRIYPKYNDRRRRLDPTSHTSANI